jgi:hypothetical protein
MQPPKQEDDGAEQAKAAQQAESEIQFKQKEAEMAVKEKAMAAEQQAAQHELDLQLREAQLKVDQDIFKMQQQAAQQSLTVKAQSEGQKLDFKQKTAEMENKKYKTENVVNQKADATITKSVNDLKGLVESLAKTVATQAQAHQGMIDTMTKSMSAPRRKKAIRGKDGRIEAVEDEVA